ncbi:MAG: TonB family protein, partial [Gammaproteobacteria bacterium]|nr:TonB family protein [Gammaproteobacteria bacterium]
VVTPAQPTAAPGTKRLEVKRQTLKLEMNPGLPAGTSNSKPPAGPQPAVEPSPSSALQTNSRQQAPLTPGAPVSAPPASQPVGPVDQSARHKTILRTPPSPAHIVSPRYPRAAFLKGTKGSVTIRFTIEPNGSTGNIRILAATPPGIFEQATRDAVQEWEFIPATVNGRPVASTVTRTLIFKPPPQKSQPPAQQAQATSDIPANRVPANIHPLRVVRPEYPPDAYRARRGGRVTVQFTVGTDGKPRDIRILRADPPHTFDEAVRQAVSQWRFEPVDAPTEVVQTIKFTPPH